MRAPSSCCDLEYLFLTELSRNYPGTVQMAAEARAAWKALKRQDGQIGEQLWLRHVVKPGEHHERF